MPKSELHRRKMADKKSKRQPDEPTPVIDSSSDDDDEPGPRQQRGQKKSKGIKWKYVAFLALFFGSAILPVVLWIVDHAGGLLGTGTHKAIGASTARMGLTPTPKDRLAKFYEKHNPEKVSSRVVKIISSRSTLVDYPKMIKVLEAKYGDYGFFLGWEQDRTFGKFLKTQAGEVVRSYSTIIRDTCPIKLGSPSTRCTLY